MSDLVSAHINAAALMIGEKRANPRGFQGVP